MDIKRATHAWALSEGNNAAKARILAYVKKAGAPGFVTGYLADNDSTSYDEELAEQMQDVHEAIHMKGIPHSEEPDCMLYEDSVKKGFNPVGKSWIVEKAWTEDENTFIEGWVSTPDIDLEKDVVEPEAFLGETFKGYYERRAPLSSEHNTKALPVGHLQKGVLVRDGRILQTETHPSDPADFAHFPGTGTGWYARGVITDPATGSAVQKGNIGAFSWIGNLREYEPRVGGGRRYQKIDPLIESTVAAYPVNPKAVMQVAKAFLNEDKQMEKSLEEIMAETATKLQEKKDAEKAVAKGVTEERLGELLTQFKDSLLETVNTSIQKSFTDKQAEDEQVQKAQGVGRKGTISGSSNDPREENPAKYIIQKAKSVDANGTAGYATFDPTDKAIAWAITLKGLTQGMRDDAGIEDEEF